MAQRRRILRALLAIVGISIIVVMVVVTSQSSLILPYGLGPYLVTGIGLIAVSAVDRLIDFIGGKDKKIPENGSGKPYSQIPEFSADLSPMLGLRVGAQVKFKASISGQLRNCGLQTEILPPKGKPYSASYEKIFRRRSRDFLTKGTLNGSFNGRSFEWPWNLPVKAPSGEWVFQIRLYERLPYRTWWVSIRIWIIVGLKRWIEAIDLRVLDQPKWSWIEKEYKVIVSS